MGWYVVLWCCGAFISGSFAQNGMFEGRMMAGKVRLAVLPISRALYPSYCQRFALLIGLVIGILLPPSSTSEAAVAAVVRGGAFFACLKASEQR